MPDWISLRDDPPKENGRYLCTNGYEVDIGWYSVKHKQFIDSDGWRYFAKMVGVTHWMPLPKPKKEE